MTIKDYKCKCGHSNFFFAPKGSQKGIYCSHCGKWLKWADKDEQNLTLKQEPCEDAVSRRKVFSAIHNTHLPKEYEEPLWNKISTLSSVTPKNDVLDKTRAEIAELRSKQNVGVLECLDIIIDKYRNGDADFDCEERENDEMGKIQVTVEINNMAELTRGHWWVVVRYIDGRLWYYGAYGSEKRASYVAEELKNALVVEIEKP